MNPAPQTIFLGKVALDIIFKKSFKGGLKPVGISLGGSIFNTAIILSRLAVRSGIFLKISEDILGLYIRDFLERERLDKRFIQSSPDLKIPIAIAALGRTGNPRYSFYKARERKETSIRFEEGNLKFFKDAKAAYFGSSFSYSDASFEVSRRFLNIAKRNRLSIFYDPNIRVNAIKNSQKIKKRVIGFIKESDVVKLSREDIGFITGEAGLKRSLYKLRRKTGALIILTLGKNGALSMDKRNHIVKTDAFKIKAVDTIGAGDAFGAGILFKFCESSYNMENFLDNIEKNLIFAQAASALTCLYHGALSGINNAGDIKRFLKANHGI